MSTPPVENVASPPAKGEESKFPWVALLALATAAFVGILTEALPAGMLPEMSASLAVSESAMGQALTVYAIASAVTAIPLFALTATWRRKPLLLGAIAVIALSNLVTAISPDYLLTMVFRFLGGVAAGLIWALLVEYARRLAPPHLQGRAIAVTMGGVPLALSLGIPVGTFLSGIFDWRTTFLLVTLLGVVLLAWVLASVPDHRGRRGTAQASVMRAFTSPGVIAVLFVVAAYVLAHNILYTYIATFLIEYDMGGSISLVLLIFGIASMVSILVVGAQVDRRLRMLTIASTVLFAVGTTLLAVFAESGPLVLLAAALWGLGWGGITTLMQTAVTDAGGDAAQALLVTTWNGFMAAGGAVGGILLEVFGPRSFPWSVLLLLVPVLIVVVVGRRHAFPAQRPGMAP